MHSTYIQEFCGFIFCWRLTFNFFFSIYDLGRFFITKNDLETEGLEFGSYIWISWCHFRIVIIMFAPRLQETTINGQVNVWSKVAANQICMVKSLLQTCNILATTCSNKYFLYDINVFCRYAAMIGGDMQHCLM